MSTTNYCLFLPIMLLAFTCVESKAIELNESQRDSINNRLELSTDVNDSEESKTAGKKSFLSRWTITGFAEIALTRNFDKLGDRVSSPIDDYPAWNLFLPKSTIWVEFDCGKSWTVGTQVAFVNTASVVFNGPGSPDDRKMEWSPELSLEEFWVQKMFCDAAGLKVGLIGTPVGQQNDYPVDFFGVTRPEDGPEFLAINNQSPGVSFLGDAGAWHYEVMAIPGLTSYDFGNSGWKYGDGSYEQSINRLYAGAFRVDNSSIDGLTLSLSGEFGGGTTTIDGNPDENVPDRRISSGVSLGAFDFRYDNYNWIARGAFQYGYISNHDKDHEVYRTLGPIHDLQAMSAGGEVGFDFFSLNQNLSGKQKFYLFGRYDFNQYQDWRSDGKSDQSFWNTGHRFSLGVNWYPISSILVKGEWCTGFGNDPMRTNLGISISWIPALP